jgi:peptide chain release factor
MKDQKCWLQITSGRGPVECCWVVAKLAEILPAEAKKAGLTAEVIEAVKGSESKTLRSALLSLSSNKNDFISQWEGSILWIGKSSFRPHHKRKNWFVGIEAIRIPESIKWSEKELKIETMRASGPGGQHVNKVETAVRIIHTPTGLTATASEERSQLMNKKLALARLSLLLKQKQEHGEKEAQQKRWQQHNDLERGNPVRSYKGVKFKLVSST